MTPVKGRTAHAIYSPAGGLITAPLLASAFGASGAYEWARRFQVEEQPGCVLRVRMETRRPPLPAERSSLLLQLAEVTANQYAIRLEFERELPLAPTGKFQYVVPLASQSHATRTSALDVSAH